MAYGFETDSFSELANRFRDYPEQQELPVDRGVLAELSELYLAALADLFSLMGLIMSARFEQSKRGMRYAGFLRVYEGRVRILEQDLRAFLFGSLGEGDIFIVHDFLDGVRRSALHEELVVLYSAINESSGDGEDADADEAAGTTVTNSLKEQIERRVKLPYIKDVLHAINEVLSVARGVT